MICIQLVTTVLEFSSEYCPWTTDFPRMSLMLFPRGLFSLNTCVFVGMPCSFALEVTWCCFLFSGLVTGEACGQHPSVDMALHPSGLPHGTL